ncbi:MtrB/PioB family decaheme-associated outer membrane protein [Wenzhouxiangella marina]|uniref:MtrB/PioB family decaheme-associated outer membrane protein n=1 Tax=Wenzhouxiangella marina TaxID=1579979 RepID=UPI00067384F7|nr:MtrB/PioB family decaheme-associated outer membrane protein [Wenzhouxiangella marina]MBB6088037.1 MtrB/PioB family decaheme-associated outer membrane protein [Wenzhouxiangella marina]
MTATLIVGTATAVGADRPAGQADDTGSAIIEVGLGHVSDEDSRFGRYRGLDDDGLFGLLGLDWLRRPAAGADDGWTSALLIIDGSLESGRGQRLISARLSQPGRVRLQFDQRRFSDRRAPLQSIHRRDGDRLVLPPDWQAGTTTDTFSQLLPSLQAIDPHQTRDRRSLSGRLQLDRGWQLSAGVREERREGLGTVAGLFGNSGGNPRAAFLPAPIDYRTHSVDAEASWSRPGRQWLLGYHASLFSNDQPGIAFDNPFSTIGGWAEGSGYPTGRGELAGPPDNQFHQLRLATRWRLPGQVDLLADLGVGRMSQDEPFLPYTANPVLAESITQPLPRASLDGRVDTTTLNLRLNGRLGERHRWSASGRLDDRDNHTPRLRLVGIGGDSERQDPDPVSSATRFNLPYDYRDLSLGLKLDSRWNSTTRSRLGARLRRTERSLTARARTERIDLEALLRQTLGPRAEGSLSMTWSDRGGSAYEGGAGFIASHDPAWLESQSRVWENLPTLRQYHLADRREHRLAATLQLQPASAWTLGFEAARRVQDFHGGEFGLREARVDQLHGHLRWQFTPATALSAFASWDRQRLEQSGFSFRGSIFTEADLADPGRAWQVEHDDRARVAGLSAEHRWLQDRLQLKADWVLARSSGTIDTVVGAALSAEALPELRTRLSTLALQASWTFTPRLIGRLRYWREDFASRDWAIDGVAVDQLANILLPGEASPDETVHVIGMSLQWQLGRGN